MVAALDRLRPHASRRSLRVDTTLDGFTGGLTPFSQGSNPQVGQDGTALHRVRGHRSARRWPATGSTTTTRPWWPARPTTAARSATSIVDTDFDFPLNEEVGSLTLTGENFRINSYPQLAVRPGHRPAGADLGRRPQRPLHRDGESIRTNGDIFVASSPRRPDWTDRRDRHAAGRGVPRGRDARRPGRGQLRTPGTTTRTASGWTTRTGRGRGDRAAHRRRSGGSPPQTANPQVQFVGGRAGDRRVAAGRVHRRLLARSRSAPTCGCTRAGPTSAAGPASPRPTRTPTRRASRS